MGIKEIGETGAGDESQGARRYASSQILVVVDIQVQFEGRKNGQ